MDEGLLLEMLKVECVTASGTKAKRRRPRWAVLKRPTRLRYMNMYLCDLSLVFERLYTISPKLSTYFTAECTSRPHSRSRAIVFDAHAVHAVHAPLDPSIVIASCDITGVQCVGPLTAPMQPLCSTRPGISFSSRPSAATQL